MCEAPLRRGGSEATRAPSSYNAAALNAWVSSRRSAALMGGRSSQSIRCSGAVMAISGHSRCVESASAMLATSPELSYLAITVYPGRLQRSVPSLSVSGRPSRTSAHHGSREPVIASSWTPSPARPSPRPGIANVTVGLPSISDRLKLRSSNCALAIAAAVRRRASSIRLSARTSESRSRPKALFPSRAIRAPAVSPKTSMTRCPAPERRSITPRRVVCHGWLPWRSTSTWYSYERYGPSTSRISSSAVAVVAGSGRTSSSGSSGRSRGCALAYNRARRGTMVSTRTAVLSPLANPRRYKRSPNRRASSKE